MSTDIPDLIAGALGVSRGTAYDMMREALAKQYAEKNSLGGPAKVFDAMADAIRAGDDYHAVLRQYGFVEAQQQEPFGYFKPEPFGWTDCAETDEGAIALYDRPPASKPWVGLTDEEVGYIADEYATLQGALRAIEAKLREKNT